MKTLVYICFNGASLEYIFNIELEVFLKKWNNHIPAVGYFSDYDEDGKFVVIIPSNCGVVDFRKWD